MAPVPAVDKGGIVDIILPVAAATGGSVMHEYALALDIMSTLREKYPEDIDRLTSISLTVGQFSGVVTDSLDFCLHMVLKDQKLPEAKVVIEEEEAMAECACGERYPLTDLLQPCPRCGAYDRHLLSGKGIMIRSIEVEKEEISHGQ